MADSVRDLRRTLERECVSRGQEAPNAVTTRTSSTPFVPIILVAGCIAIVTVLTLRKSQTTTMSDPDPLLQLF